MNTRQAQYIITIAAEGSISAAARKLNVSQPSLSQMIRQIERENGVALFDRTSFPMSLTYAGEKYVECARTILAISEKLENQLQDIREENSGRLRLGISPQREMVILPRVLPRFNQHYPGITLQINEEGSAKMEELLRCNEIDIALASTSVISASFQYILIEKETVGILTGRSSHLAETRENGSLIRLDEAKDQMFVSLKQGHGIRHVQDQLFRTYDMNPRILLETDSMEVAKRVTLACGACMLCSNTYYDDHALKHGMFFPLKDFKNSNHFYACTRKGETLPRYASDFIRYVREALSEKPGFDGSEDGFTEGANGA